MPKAGMDMKEGVLVRWLKEIGDAVEKDEPIMEIETDKIAMEVESHDSGYLLAKLVEEGSVVPVLQVIGYIGDKGETVPRTSLVMPAQESNDAGSEEQTAEYQITKSLKSQDSSPAVTPYARKLAKENGVDLSQVVASGLRGEIVSRDVLSATPLAKRIASDKGITLDKIAGSGYNGKVRKEDVLSSYDSTKTADQKPLSNQRKVIAKKMLQSHSEIPVVTQHMKVNADNLLEFRRQANLDHDEKITINDLMIKIVAVAVRDHPVFRSKLEDNNVVIIPEVNIGFAVGMDEGLMVPVIHNADKMSLRTISSMTKELINKTRANGLKMEDITGGCFTISNLGMYDIFAFTPIINQPESGILGVNAVQEELYLDGDTLKKRNYMMISLTYDHRITDGVGASKFQIRIKELMQNPLLAII